MNIANESFTLGERISESKLVRKVLRSLSRIFDIKVIAIEETHDIKFLKLDELFGSLRTFEILISDRDDKKGKEISFQFVHEKENLNKNKSLNDNINESMLAKQFFKVVKKFMRSNNFGYSNRN